ncbi:ASCC1 protein [Schizosaccharomyces pombe]|uniref:Uncharacterized protein C15D4.13c n=1 Tax=Schizosaccharomyces pombe (strain 972 / ATCC 24843) TaxID=284812 RepID=YOGD_SCHPO|nr:putative ASCC1 family protein [Schizosaccharomyces pombe]A6X982.2 RecName: Full=Uncharacterized protein C15D4.13c [Schizosaccharomyces pombe 972h-]CAO77666.2 human ASCC1 ortholog (predicted) [Schizosaccharomyces pombe]|eukprot:NP_001343046.1 putative ASCC1 family protein [Schizosaccharomyces pombe]
MRYPNLLFLALPISEHYIEESLKYFKLTSNDPMILSGFRGPRVSHLTIGMIPVKNDEDVLKCMDFLYNKEDEIRKSYGEKKITIDLKGTSFFGKSPQEAKVLYATPVDKHNEWLKVIFTEHNLFTKDARPLTLHCTLLNSRYIKYQGRRIRFFNSEPFMEKYGQFLWAHNIELDKLSIMKTGAVGEPGNMYYEELASIPLLVND